MLLTGLAVFACAFVLSCVLIPRAQQLALRWGLLDHPDGRRKMQAKPIPLVGGPVMIVTLGVILLGGYWLSGYWHGPLTWPSSRWLGAGLAAALSCGLGVLDDLHLLRGRHKLAGQVAVALVAVLSGFLVERIHILGWDIDLGLLAIPFTMFW